jgi:hypothetical protein
VNTALYAAKRIFTLGPAEADHWSALRVGASVAIPSLALIILGHEHLLLYVVFGAFTGMYGRHESHRGRMRHQLHAALMLIAGVGIGALLAAGHASAAVLVLTECIFAGLASLYSDRIGLRPSGPFFGIFALGACASVAAVPPATAIALATASAACALLFGAAGWAKTREWQKQPRRPNAVSPAKAASYVAAIALAGGLSVTLHIGHPNWAMAAAAVPLSAIGLRHRLTRGAHRILGTLAGIGLAALILLTPGIPRTPLVLAMLVVALQFPTELFMTRNYGLALVFFTPLILLMTQLANPMEPGALLTDRAIETVGGALVGMAVAIVAGARRRGARM